eukprot:TRINITY_DN2601_c1_g1::TRINITY_DN2601_c1_g1_i1::g.19461::m.19461 TRINITY_DN2601_c1_g1::TRINITY_DN2601_c1_g1_i1::g.19461  ORF type:complete len:458 (+),score=223.10,sp/P26641/EF1G_HUMAN/43.08/4e-111,EF1G/PF00647.14/3.3e-40,GST_N/PF02798.15/1.1e-16,GST_N/PF02798.15/8.6e+03,GST_C/PF00043.20/2.8e-12,GST_C/PF00043.20/9.1e+03,GST_N_3/PF13417.1/2.5e-10,GST_N_2/PF13409.1/3.2e-10,GST_C_3/PF14497.1/3.8e-09,GST_C_3/PF14497.1/4.5e+03,GST_C_2/PF13410.1/1.7e-05,DUF1510/PF07423.6/0.011,Ycf1/PF05758.7/0.029,NARP
MPMKLYTYPENPRALKALVAAQYNGVNIEIVSNFQFGVTNRTAEFLSYNPFGKVPTLVTEDGQGIFESNAIARYVARIRNDTGLFGQTFAESGKVDSWIDYEPALIASLGAWVYPLLGYVPYSAEAINKAKEEVRTQLAVLDKYLATRTYMVGQRITLADIILASSLTIGYKLVFDEAYRKDFVNLNRWFHTIINQPQFKAVLPSLDLCKTPLSEKDAKANFAKMNPEANKKEEKKPAAKKEEKKEAPKKEEKKAEKKEEKKVEKDDEGDEENFDEPKAKSKLDLLPPSKMVMDAWKRVYSNEDTRKSAIPKFWEMYDPEGYSLYFCSYKYNSELSGPVFLASNQVGGWFQRLDNLRKYGFGNVLITGAVGALEISGVWLFRGTEVPEEMSVGDDYVLYDWRKLDQTKADDKELIEDYWAWDGKLGGRKFLDGKTFK